MKVGIQSNGESPDSIKKMALKAFLSKYQNNVLDVADIGAGKGELYQFVGPYARTYMMVDDFNPAILDTKVQFMKCDLNSDWALPGTFDFVFSLEVVEHLENPRHFFRQFSRALKPGGLGFVSTPNNINLISRIIFLLTGEHRYFQDLSYPAHITCLVKKDLQRLVKENGLEEIGFYYNHEDVIPFIGKKINLPFACLSNSIGILFTKN